MAAEFLIDSRVSVPMRPVVPRSRALAQRDLPLWEGRLELAIAIRQAAEREETLARGELAVVRDIAGGEYEP